mgnify:CR=1 FL=1|jgi:uncharacterized protein
MAPEEIIRKYYRPGSKAYEFLLTHSRQVAQKALQVARGSGLELDLKFLQEAAMLHDIGIFRTHAPLLGCYGSKPYICHGVLGRQILEAEGLVRHALVAERHVGVGLTVEDIRRNNFPLPLRDMTPQSLEEKLVSFADLFFSKVGDPLKEKSLKEVKPLIASWGQDKLRVFEDWLRLFRYPAG